MTITAAEYRYERRGDAFSGRERDYLVTGTGGDADLDENSAIAAAVATAPATVSSNDGTLELTNASISQVLSPSRILVTVQYGEAGFSGAAVTPVGTVEYQFSYQAPSEHIVQSLETISCTSGFGAANKDMFGGAIGVQRNADGSWDIEGVDTAPGNTTNTWQFTNVAITSSYELLVEAMMGAVNAIPFKNRETGSLRLVSATSQVVSGNTNKSLLGFGFQRIPNQSNIKVGSLTVPYKEGHDLLWVHRDLTETTTVGTSKIVVPLPKFALVERIFPRANFSTLGF